MHFSIFQEEERFIGKEYEGGKEAQYAEQLPFFSSLQFSSHSQVEVKNINGVVLFEHSRVVLVFNNTLKKIMLGCLNKSKHRRKIYELRQRELNQSKFHHRRIKIITSITNVWD